MKNEKSINQELLYKEYLNREEPFVRVPYQNELDFYSAVCSGNMKKVEEYNRIDFTRKQGFGILSENHLQNLKYHFAITTALIARYCIEEGMEMTQAYSLSDFYIQKADAATSLDELSSLHRAVSREYTERMLSMKKRQPVSSHIADCLDYIYDHLHTRMTVDLLAKKLHLNSSYLSRLFKKEMNISLSEYILLKKLETAANMLIHSEYSVAQISFTLAFPSQSYFTEVFRKRYGTTPRNYRSSNFRTLK